MNSKNLLKLLTGMLFVLSVGALQAQSCGAPLSITPGTPITGASTTGSGSNWNVTPCSAGSSYVSDNAAEENDIYAYTPTQNEDFTVTLSNGSTDWGGVHVTDGCNDAASTCVGFETLRNGDPAVVTGSFCANTTYYIAVSTWPTPNTIDYDLALDVVAGSPSCDCPADQSSVSCDDMDPCTENDVELSVGGVACGPCAGTPIAPDLTPSCGDVVDYPCGPGGTYNANESTSWVYCPDAGTYASITFTYVDLETNGTGCFDELNISAGMGNAPSGDVCGEPDGDGGVGTGLAPGDCFFATDPDDCITITLTSDGSVQESGFAFTADCDAAPPSGTCGLALPIELIDFTGQVQKEGNLLSWVTASEQNTDVHIVERSTDGSRWNEIAVADAAGNSIEKTFYEFLDTEPESKSFYRLKSVGLNRSAQHSEVIILERVDDNFGITNIFPNPMSNDLTVQFNSDRNVKVDVIVTDLIGRIIQKDVFSAVDGRNNYQLDATNFASGVYFLSLDNGIEQLTQRVVKN